MPEPIDLDAIEAMTGDPYQYAQVSPEVTRGYLSALLAELRATTGDLAVAVEVAKERGEATADLRAGIKALRDDWRLRPGADYLHDHADALDALLRERAR